MQRPLAALTGATGFLGRHVAQALHEQGWRLRVLARGQAVPDGLESLQPEVVAGRLADREALEALAAGAQAVVHIAGSIKAVTPRQFLTANAGGAAATAQAMALRAPGACFLLVSSLSAREPRLSPYAASKAAGEGAVRGMLAPEQLTIVRPPAIYGPGDRETLALFQAAEALPLLPMIGGPEARLALIHVADAAAQIAALAAQPAQGAVFAITDDRPQGYGWRELAEAAADAVGRPLRTARIPAAMLLGIGAANSLLGRLGAPPQILSLGKAREMLHPDWSVSPEELARDLPPPRFGIAKGFADAVDWYRKHGWLKGHAVPRASPEA
jgi:nucleoside-diphosphate-sugar epimerase